MKSDLAEIADRRADDPHFVPNLKPLVPQKHIHLDPEPWLGRAEPTEMERAMDRLLRR